MEFFLITLGIMSISILLIHKVTQFIGFELKYRSLLLCAAMALIVNFATLTFSVGLTRSHYFLLAGFVLAAATFVTWYNAYLLRHEPAAANGASIQETATAVTESVEEDPPAAIAPPISVPVQTAVAAPAKKSCLDQSAEKAPVISTAKVNAAKISTAKKAAQEPQPIAVPAVPAAAKPTAKRAIKPAAAPTAAKQPAAQPAAAASSPNFAEPVIHITHRKRNKAAGLPKRRAVILPAAAMPQPEPIQLPAVLVKTIAEVVHEDMENDRLLKLTAAIAKLGSLDAILDYAFDQKERHNYSNAIFAYKRALSRYHDDEYAPFIIIELGNIYKENGAYEEAIHIYMQAFALPALKGSGAIREEFSRNLAYLRVVEYILSRHNASKTSFGKISPEYLQEIEAVFQNRRKQKSVS